MEMDNNQKLDDLFNQARTESPKVSFEEVEHSFLKSTNGISSSGSSTGTSHVFTFKTWTIMLSTLITMALSAYFISGNVEEDKTQKLSAQEQVLIEMKALEGSLLLPEEAWDDENPEVSNQQYEPIFPAQQRIEETVKPEVVAVEKLDPTLMVLVDTTKNEEAYRFPILTEDEKKSNAKLKAKMIKQLIKRDKKKYAYIPSGTSELDGQNVSVRPFHMQNTEVSNLEYRIFLFDLLEQGEQTKFLKAKPDQNNWLDENGLNASMAEFYFSHPAYDNYPVNNISREGVEMYCIWLTEQANMVLKAKNKPLINDVRLPSNTEWIYAAKGGMKKLAYPWGGPYARNAQGCYLANFSPEGQASNEDGIDITAPVSSYSPNDYGLYCMSGNMAEMVYYKNDKSQPGTRGGSWTSSVQEIQIEGADKFKGITTPNVSIGFRVVISYGIVGVAGIKNMK